MPRRSVDISDRRALQARTIDAILAEAERRSACAVPVFEPDGRITEIHLFRDGALRASLFKPGGQGMGVWLAGEDRSVLENDADDAVCRGLQKRRNNSKRTLADPTVSVPAFTGDTAPTAANDPAGISGAA